MTEDDGSTSEEKKKVKKEVKEKKNEESFCAVCVVRLSSKSQADMHFNGSKHKKMVNLRTGIGENNNKVLLFNIIYFQTV